MPVSRDERGTMKIAGTVLAWVFNIALSYCFMSAWLQVTPDGASWTLAGVAIAGAMCWLITRVGKEAS
jgi:hypothetical protein